MSDMVELPLDELDKSQLINLIKRLQNKLHDLYTRSDQQVRENNERLAKDNYEMGYYWDEVFCWLNNFGFKPKDSKEASRCVLRALHRMRDAEEKL